MPVDVLVLITFITVILWGMQLYCSHFIDKKTKAQNDFAFWPKVFLWLYGIGKYSDEDYLSSTASCETNFGFWLWNDFKWKDEVEIFAGSIRTNFLGLLCKQLWE